MSELVTQVELQPLNTFSVKAIAQSFIQVDSVESVIENLSLIQTFEQRFILGGGSNLLLVGEYDGLIIYPQFFGITVVAEEENQVRVRVGASQNWHEFVEYSLNNGWYGLENLALIPGTVGAAPVQNIGAYGVEVKQFIHKVTGINLVNGQVQEMTADECEFDYRDSVFKREGQGLFLITSVEFNLKKIPELCLNYRPLKEFFQNQPSVTPGEVMSKVCEIRREKLPDPLVLPNAGSFFKNPVVTKVKYEDLLKKYPDIVAYPADEHMKLAAGWLIEQAGLKGFTLGKVGVHKHQALVLVNYGESDGNQILRLAQKVQTEIYGLFKVRLEPEVRVIGESSFRLMEAL